MIEQIRVVHERNKVLLLHNGRPPIELPWGAALKIAHAINRKAAIACEYERHKQIISDQSILLAAGAPVTITSTGKGLREALKQAEYHGGTRNGIDNALLNENHVRQSALKGIKSKTIVGHATVSHVPTGNKVTKNE